MSDEWRETTDPDELAAAVAAGVRVEFATGPDSWSQTNAPHISGARYRVPAWWEYESPRADAVELLRDLQDAACSVMARPDVLGMLHGQTRHALSDLIVDLALALDSQAVMS